MEIFHEYQPHYPPNVMEAYIRVLHASPDAPAVDVYVNNCPVVRNLSFGELTCYLPVFPGLYNIKVFPACTKDTPVIDTDIKAAPGMAYTLAATGELQKIGLMPIVDSVGCTHYYCKACVRFAHLSPNAPAVDITLPDGTILFGNVSYQDVTQYIPVDKGIYDLQVRLAGTKKVVLEVPNVRLESDRFYTVYAIGLVSTTPPLQALLAEDNKPTASLQ